MVQSLQKSMAAVLVQRAYKKYMSRGKAHIILNGLNMTIPRGCIYGLLGASGCGKTTLLNCILNFKRLDSGEIRIFGAAPGTKESGIPGVSVGYMPQELGLMVWFTIEEAIWYFGRITGLTKDRIASRTHFLTTLLDLPNLTTMIYNLSGGQQRRTSLACALVHEPELLILDEPTVGIDSILRHEIWSHLLKISKRSTIIITTHYIEETAQADIVAFLREGRLLGEDSPGNMMLRLNVDTLEEVFLKLSVQQNAGNDTDLIVNNVDYDSQNIFRRDVIQNTEICQNIRKQRLSVIMWKHWVWAKRNPFTICMFFVLSILQIVTFCLAIGHNPTDIKVGIINYEVDPKSCNYNFSCNTTHLSCIYLKYLEENALKLIYGLSEENMVRLVTKGELYAAMIIKANYSRGLRNRVKQWNFASGRDFEQSEIEVTWDTTNAAISTFIRIYLYNWFQLFVQNYLEKCNINGKVLTLPVRIEKAVHGSKDLNFTEYYLPGVTITTIFFMCITLTALYIILDRQGGDMERTLLSGVTTTDIFLMHMVTQSVPMLGQVLQVFAVIFILFGITLNGSLLLVLNLGCFTGLCGMAYGLFIASICTKEFAAITFALGSVIPTLFISGTIWPTQCMNIQLQWISSLIPLTKAVESLRSVLIKGWGITHSTVYNGFIILTVWILLFVLFAIISHKFAKRT